MNRTELISTLNSVERDVRTTDIAAARIREFEIDGQKVRCEFVQQFVSNFRQSKGSIRYMLNGRRIAYAALLVSLTDL